jgi:hypothetical protein
VIPFLGLITMRSKHFRNSVQLIQRIRWYRRISFAKSQNQKSTIRVLDSRVHKLDVISVSIKCLAVLFSPSNYSRLTNIQILTSVLICVKNISEEVLNDKLCLTTISSIIFRTFFEYDWLAL